MIIAPKVRGFICLTAHPAGCEKNVVNQIDYVKSKGHVEGPKKVLIIEGVRENWIPKPIKIAEQNISFLTSLNLQNAILANAFEIKDIPYFWKKCKIEQWKK